jgi:HD-like signal output (HDOD) protein/ActR/RegA family two-component response regulator
VRELLRDEATNLKREKTMKKRILFVDDERKVLDSLQRMLLSMRSQWEMEFAASGQEALDLLKGKSFHVVLADMRMPGMDGRKLLGRVKKLHPQVVRIMLAEYSDKDLILNSAGLTHQFLCKPCGAEALKKTIAGACAMCELLEDESLTNVISKIGSLPSLPSLYKEVVEEVNSRDVSLARVGEIVSKDVGMSAKLLQLVNSAFFGLPEPVSSTVRAVKLLGLETIKTLILTIKIFSQFHRTALPCYSISSLLDHSISTGILARSMATQEDLGQSLIDEAFMAGLLHDMGKLILLDKLPLKCREIADVINSSACELHQAEQKVLGTSHAQVGAYLMGIWGFSESIVEAIAFHHCPSKCSNSSFGILTIIHLANAFGHHDHGEKDGKRLDTDYLDNLGIAGIPDVNRAMYAESM